MTYVSYGSKRGSPFSLKKFYMEERIGEREKRALHSPPAETGAFASASWASAQGGCMCAAGSRPAGYVASLALSIWVS